jgi:hypothetical protein
LDSAERSFIGGTIPTEAVMESAVTAFGLMTPANAAREKGVACVGRVSAKIGSADSYSIGRRLRRRPDGAA